MLLLKRQIYFLNSGIFKCDQYKINSNIPILFFYKNKFFKSSFLTSIVLQSCVTFEYILLRFSLSYFVLNRATTPFTIVMYILASISFTSLTVAYINYVMIIDKTNIHQHQFPWGYFKTIPNICFIH